MCALIQPSCVPSCRAANVLRTETAVDAVEVFDRISLGECEKDEKMVKLVSSELRSAEFCALS